MAVAAGAECNTRGPSAAAAADPAAVLRLPVGPTIGRVDSSQTMNKVFEPHGNEGPLRRKVQSGSRLAGETATISTPPGPSESVRLNDPLKLPVGPMIGRVDSSQMMNKVFEIKSDRQSGGSPSKKTRTGSGLNPNA